MGEHYYTEDPSSEIKEKTFTESIKDKTLSFRSVSGVFSFEGRIDKASELLIKAFAPSGSSILDLGCGYGAIGLFLKALYNGQDVWLSDINSRAVDYARLNAAANSLKAAVVRGDLYSGLSGRTFDDIVTNPPIAAGKKLNTKLIEEAPGYLNPGGCLWLVAFHNKGGSTLKEIMKSRFGNVQDVEKGGGIRVYRSVLRKEIKT